MKAEHWALGLSIVLVIHAALITKNPGNNWLRRAKRYRAHQCVGVAVAFVPLVYFVGACVGALGATASEENAPQSQLLTASLVVFMFGMLRSCFDLAAGGRPREKPGAWDAFLFALVAAIILDLLSNILRAEEHMASVMAMPTNHVIGLMGVAVASGIYVVSLWGLLARQLGQVDGFSPPAVAAFLRSLLPEVPLQVVLIGPKQSGKTRIACSLTRENYENRKDSGQPWSAVHHGSIDLAHVPKTKNGDKAASFTRQRLMLSVVDTPGERMGQHLAAAILNRTDALVLVLNLRAIPTKHNSVSALLSDLQGKVDPIEVSVREYLTALRFATDGAVHTSAPRALESLRLTYKARSFCLVVYGEGQSSNQPPARLDMASVRSLAVDMARMFGIEAGSCVGCAYLAVNPNYSVNSQEFLEVVARTALEG